MDFKLTDAIAHAAGYVAAVKTKSDADMREHREALLGMGILIAVRATNAPASVASK